jgi:hypothetical protein
MKKGTGFPPVQKPSRVSGDEAREVLLRIINSMKDNLSANAIQVLSLMWGVANGGRRWTFEQAVEELKLPPGMVEVVDDEIKAVLLLYAEGVAEGHFQNPAAA